MVEDGPYEIMPYKEIMSLKRDIDSLKKRQTDVSSNELLDGMHKLSNNMADLIEIFRAASIEVKEEVSKEKQLAESVKHMLDKLHESMDENKVIADGILAVSDNMEKKFIELNQRLDGMEVDTETTHTEVHNTPVQQRMPPPRPLPQMNQPYQQTTTTKSMSFEQRPLAPPPMPGMGQPMPPPSFNNNLPPPTPSSDNFDDLFPEPPKKQGVFGRMFKK